MKLRDLLQRINREVIIRVVVDSTSYIGMVKNMHEALKDAKVVEIYPVSSSSYSFIIEVEINE